MIHNKIGQHDIVPHTGGYQWQLAALQQQREAVVRRSLSQGHDTPYPSAGIDT